MINEVTFIVAVKNDVRVFRALDSIAAQVLPEGVRVSIVVVDDSDEDQTYTHIEYGDFVQVLRSDVPGGVYRARNLALTHIMKQDQNPGLVGFLNADDVLADHHVVKDILECTSNDSCVRYGHVLTRDSKGTIVRRYVNTQAPDDLGLLWWYKGHMLPDPGVFWPMSVFTHFRIYDESFAIASDYDFMLRVIAKGKTKVKMLDRVVAIMDSGGISGRASRLEHIKERRRAWIKNDLKMGLVPIITHSMERIEEFLFERNSRERS